MENQLIVGKVAQTTQNDKPVWKSKRFVSMIAAAIGMLITAYLPIEMELQALIVTFIGITAYAVINGYSLQDVELAKALREEIAKPGISEKFISAVGTLVDAGESVFRVDIPDGLEKEAKERLRQWLQSEVNRAAANQPKVPFI